MAAPPRNKLLKASAPVEAVRSPEGTLLLIMTGLREQPVSGRLLRGLGPYLDEQGAQRVLLLTERRRREPWGSSDQPQAYRELVHWTRGADGGEYRGTTWKGPEVGREEILRAFKKEPAGTVDWVARRTGAAVIGNREPLALVPCVVEKPWGKEVWYTGIEKRGRSWIRTASGQTELPYALGMFPTTLLGDERPPVLLKTLDPLPEPVLGDLYLEVHERKWEVYVVLDVHRSAWPDGVGRLRAGLNAAVMERYQKDHGARWTQVLMEDLRVAIQRYEMVRRALDEKLDAALASRGLDPVQGVPAPLYGELSSALPAHLQEQERRLRLAVEGYLGHVPMPEGAVACLPPGVLHSLQHGVKVVEFQTPTYERLIAMFGQKVLTQAHWDTERALQHMDKGTYTPPHVEPLAQGPGWSLERIVRFPEFEVRRLTVQPGQRYIPPPEEASRYTLLIGTQGQGQVLPAAAGPVRVEKEGAWLLPAGLGAYALEAGAEQALGCLITVPLPLPPGPTEGALDAAA